MRVTNMQKSGNHEKCGHQYAKSWRMWSPICKSLENHRRYGHKYAKVWRIMKNVVANMQKYRMYIVRSPKWRSYKSTIAKMAIVYSNDRQNGDRIFERSPKWRSYIRTIANMAIVDCTIANNNRRCMKMY